MLNSPHPGCVGVQVDSGVATAEEAEECISSEFNPVRAGFLGSADVWTRDVLNLGVRPDCIIAKARTACHSAVAVSLFTLATDVRNLGLAELRGIFNAGGTLPEFACDAGAAVHLMASCLPV